MARKPREQVAGGFYHIYNRGVDKRPIFEDTLDYIVFFELLNQTALNHRCSVYAYCLMPNHYHLFFQTKDSNLSSFMKSLISKYVRHFNLSHERVGTLFQSRFNSKTVEKDAYLLTLVKYIHLNPLGLEGSFQKYRWSSYGEYLGDKKLPCLDKEWILNQFHINPELAKKKFEEFHLMGSGTGQTRV